MLLHTCYILLHYVVLHRKSLTVTWLTKLLYALGSSVVYFYFSACRKLLGLPCLASNWRQPAGGHALVCRWPATWTVLAAGRAAPPFGFRQSNLNWADRSSISPTICIPPRGRALHLSKGHAFHRPHARKGAPPARQLLQAFLDTWPQQWTRLRLRLHAGGNGSQRFLTTRANKTAKDMIPKKSREFLAVREPRDEGHLLTDFNILYIIHKWLNHVNAFSHPKSALV